MKLTFLFFASTVLLACSVFAAPPVEEGKTIFSARCAGCHNINKVLTGPALAGVDKRRTIDWIVNFVHSSQTVIKKGDATAVELFNKFNHIPMPDHPDLSADNIKNIVEYIKSEATGSNPEKAPFARPSQLRPSYKPLTFANYGFFLSYIALVGLLIGVLIFAVQLKQYQRFAKEKV